jgi:hypothetical protein
MWDVVFLGAGLFAIFWLAVGPIVRNIFFGFIADIQIGDVFLDDLQRSCTVSAIGWTTISFKSDDGRRFVEMTHRDFYEKNFQIMRRVRTSVSPVRKNNNNENSSSSSDEEPAYFQSADAGREFNPQVIPDTIQKVADYVSVDFSISFLVLFFALAYFHETRVYETSVVLLIWFALQVTGSLLRQDFRNDLFWSLLKLALNVVIYIVAGHLWSYAKLYIDIRQGHFVMSKEFRECFGADGVNGCIIQELLKLKWTLGHITLTWPISMAYTLSRDPVNIFVEELQRRSYHHYYAVVHSALESSINTNTPAIDFQWWAIAFAAYFVTGYIWMHIKLFVDVWQRTLPASLEEKVMAVYNGDKSYVSVVASCKWLVLEWMITWPVSAFYTLLRHPFRILADVIYNFSVRRLAWIIGKGVELREK